MRSWLASAVIVAVAASHAHDARADPKLTELATGYQKEADSCALQLGGVTKVADGAARLQSDPGGADDKALADDVEKLTTGRAIIDAYCTELAAVLDVLAQHPTATYRSLEHDLDARDNKIRRARQASKKAVEGLEPVLHSLIPRINARVSSPAPDRRVPTKFPSGHTIELPSLPGSWRLSGSTTTDTADYTDKAITASVWTHAFASATCDQQLRTLPAADARDHATDRALTDPAKALGVAWSATYLKRAAPARFVVVACLPSKTGGWMATAELQPAEPAPTAALVDEMAELMIRMLAAAAGPAPAPADPAPATPATPAPTPSAPTPSAPATQ